jgi:hypothetical protein
MMDGPPPFGPGMVPFGADFGPDAAMMMDPNHPYMRQMMMARGMGMLGTRLA